MAHRTIAKQFDMQLQTQQNVQVSERVTPPPSTRVSRRTKRRSADTARPQSNLTYLRIIEQVTETGITQEELGIAVGASLRTIQNWASGAASPRGHSRERLLDVQFIVDELRHAYTDEGVQIWMHARNRNLGGRRPIDLLAEGQHDRVLEEATRVSGAM